jgi:hypothetical protein
MTKHCQYRHWWAKYNEMRYYEKDLLASDLGRTGSDQGLQQYDYTSAIDFTKTATGETVGAATEKDMCEWELKDSNFCPSGFKNSNGCVSSTDVQKKNSLNCATCTDNPRYAANHCPYWAGRGYCSINVKFMSANCCSSCQKTCTDKDDGGGDSCSVEARNGMCSRDNGAAWFPVNARCCVSCHGWQGPGVDLGGFRGWAYETWDQAQARR